jgi:P63C domain
MSTAQDTDSALGAIGLRSFIQKTLNYQPITSRTLSQSEIVELCCLPVPCDWQRRFPEEYYTELSRLTKLTAFGNSRPARWAQLTKELVYDYLPSGIYDEVKRCKEETGTYEKLHQFLSTDGLKILENHQRQLLTLMVASSHLNQLKTLLNQSRGVYQVLMF